jgi:glucans biosynthesis protein C
MKNKLLYKHLYFFDNLRIFLVFCVIIYHSSLVYGPWGSWYYYERTAINDPIVKLPLSLVTILLKSFFMGLLYFISGYFTPISIAKNGRRRNLINKIIYLGLPLLIYSFFIFSVLDYYYYGFYKNIPFINYLGTYIMNPDPGHLWYVELLLLFNILYVFFYKKSNEIIQIISRFKPIYLLFLSIFLITISSYVIRIWYPIGRNFFHIPIAQLPQFIIFYIFGIIFSKNNWLVNLEKINANKIFISTVLLVCTLGIIYYFFNLTGNNLSDLSGGINYYSLLYSLWESSFSVSVSFLLIAFFKKRYDFHIYTSSLSYGIYLIHFPVLLTIQILLKDIHLHTLLKFFISVVISFIVSAVIVDLYNNTINKLIKPIKTI